MGLTLNADIRDPRCPKCVRPENMKCQCCEYTEAVPEDGKWRLCPQCHTINEPMKPKPNDIITIEAEDGILHEMIVKSVDQNNRTVTGEVAHWKTSLHHAADDQKIVRTITVPDHCIR